MKILAILGLGYWGRNIVNNVQGKSGKARFAAGWNRTPDKVSDFCAESDIALKADAAEILGDSAIDGVVVAGPAHLHAESAKQALEAGKHTMVIKPIALNRADAEELRAIASSKGVVLALGFDRCFLPAADALRAHAAAGDLGKIIHAEGDFCAPRFFNLREGDWKAGNHYNPPGSLADHMLYTMIELIGPVEALSVQARNNAAPVDIADTVSVGLKFQGGATGTLTAIGVTQAYERLHVFGTAGWGEIRNRTRFEFNPVEGDAQVSEHEIGPVLLRQIDAFADAIAGDAPYPVSPDLAVNSAACFEAMHKAAASGGWETV